MTTDRYHLPVMSAECMEGLAITPDGVYLDGTLGGGGHFGQIAQGLAQGGTVIGLDRDPSSLAWVSTHLPPPNCRVILVQSTFSRFGSALAAHKITALDGVLLDLGLSSRQVDDDPRGFSYMNDTALDMRMDPTSGTTAASLLNGSDESELARILEEYGEVRNAPRMARAIKAARMKSPIRTSGGLKAILADEYGQDLKAKILAKVFQALRIAVNDELAELSNFLESVLDCLKVGGRLVVLSYHSLEDRIVKQFIRKNEQPCTCPRTAPVCICGGIIRLKRVNNRALRPSAEEVARNPRSRSARLRIAEKVA